MSECQYTKEKMKKLEVLKAEWLKDAEPYLEDGHDPQPIGGARLDGPDSVALAQIQLKYQKKIRELMENDE